MKKPIVVTLVGSSKFRDQHMEAMRQETLLGKIVIPMGLYGHLEGLDMDGPTKAMLDQLHLRKIDLADEVLIINVGDYVGNSTAREIFYAVLSGKKIVTLEGGYHTSWPSIALDAIVGVPTYRPPWAP